MALPPTGKPPAREPAEANAGRWYTGVTRAQWMVLFVASAGWVFDAYASQIFNVTRDGMLADILHRDARDPSIRFWGEIYLSIYLVGGALGGTFFGSLADRIGRRPTMILTILVYTFFSGLTCFAHTAWQVAVLRFAVALGTAGEWAVAASLVAEVFPARARAQAGSFFHATSNIGTWLASLAGLAVGANWKMGYALGVLPALLVLVIRARAPESQSWIEARKTGPKSGGSMKELLLVRPWRGRAIAGMLLASVGLGTYWCITVGGQDLIQDFLLRRGVDSAQALSRAKFGYGFLINGGGFVGSIAFGPLAQWLGRRTAFAWAMVAGAVIVPVTWYLPQTYGQLLVLLPFYGMFTFGFHAGFALYFPELFPTHLRGTGTGLCFNGGRLMAAIFLGFSGWLKSRPDLELRSAATILAALYFGGLICLRFLPETKGEQLATLGQNEAK